MNVLVDAERGRWCRNLEVNNDKEEMERQVIWG